MSTLKRMSLNIFLLKLPDDVTKTKLEEKDYLQKTTTATGKKVS